ncbi:MAG: A/G-specific adenine glycosylase [Bacteroidetes bacterium]|nr:A/G-specific adenine glycosylase [Bacteroidota bacterium]MBS1931683.1 A/G-specific adenine glycosylase [Bacteroidota bacterium]
MPKNNYLKEQFTTQLLKWNNEKNNRKMPWKGEKDPYKIWLSEIILQQTRVEQGLNYYNRFIKIFPDIHQLAKATDEKVFKMWEGLGYYSRCKNLLTTAKFISKDCHGKFPESFERIIKLKGIGPYTAAAISSFAYNLPHAVVDGNVFRVLARVFGITKSLDSSEGKKYFNRLANDLLYKKSPGIYNQAIMDFGAVICKPNTPLCPECPFKKTCYAFLHNKTDLLPVKKKKINIKNRWFYYFVLEYKGTFAISQRTHKDIWEQLFEFPLLETLQRQSEMEIFKQAEKIKILKKSQYELISFSSVYKQKLSHQLIRGQFIKIKLKVKPEVKKDWKWVKMSQIGQFAFPVYIKQFLKNRGSN